MRDAEKLQYMEAVEVLENSAQPLELRSSREAQLMDLFRISDARIQDLKSEYMPLTISGVTDKAGFDLVHSARMDIKDLRVSIDKTRKSQVADALEWQRTVNGIAKRLTAGLEPIEAHLDKQEDVYTAEIDRIKAEKQAAAQAKIQGRIDALSAVGMASNLAEIAQMSDETFNGYLRLATDAHNQAQATKTAQEAEAKAKVEAEAKARADELATLTAMREAQAKEAAVLKAERDAIETEKATAAQAVRDAEAKAAQAIREEQIRKDAIEKAKADAEVELKAAIEHIEAMKRKADEVEAARPDADKLEGFAALLEGVVLPDMATPAGQALAKEIKGLMIKLINYTRTAAGNLTK